MASKKELLRLKKIEAKIEGLHCKFSNALQEAALAVEEITGVAGECDWLPGDGIGFTCSDENVPTFVPFSDLVKMIEDGAEVTKDELIAIASL